MVDEKMIFVNSNLRHDKILAHSRVKALKKSRKNQKSKKNLVHLFFKCFTPRAHSLIELQPAIYVRNVK